MRARTVAAVGLVVAALAGVVVLGVGLPAGGGELTELWTSDTPRQNERNHHAVGASEDGRVVVAPVAEVPDPGTPLTNTSCTLARLAPEDGAVQWRTTVPPDRCFTHALSEPVVADLDGDGESLVVSTSYENALIAYDAETGEERWRVTLNESDPSFGYGRPTVADLPVSPGRDVVFSSIHGDVGVVTANGSVVWRASLADAGLDDTIVQQRPVVADVDGDGEQEVVVGSGSGLVVFEADGSVAWTRTGPSQYVVSTQADDDPARELLVGDGRTLTAVDGASGAVQWSAEPDAILRYRGVADGDGDGTAELYAGTLDGEVLAIDVTNGDGEWRTTVSADGAPVWSPVTADVDGDGDQEVVVTSRDGTVTVLAGDDGRVLATYERSVPIETHVTPADLDDDGTPELLVRYGDGRVVALDYGA
ncbi:outer membrane protein assembly factor BamB family protein [Halomarina oriensis]|uniref:PQQ-binding-like beta-propeller repeat protein n=1 Tax=Halomarina oriensis TaxID=671145 RepID=A0A6B0GIA5_9EURY|nr:PQQ-binding-like beta-propeller repeat protein [Halomarina oriensis]MWG33169.1 PQQ-binding-like beta-propeller repeat protein [Halomarina oriensis]